MIMCCMSFRQLEQLYPFFPSMGEFTHSLMPLESTRDQKNPLYIISQFALEYPRLKAGGALLPDLIHFYSWIHSELAYCVPKESAQKCTIAEVLTVVDKRFPNMAISKLYERVRGKNGRVCDAPVPSN